MRIDEGDKPTEKTIHLRSDEVTSLTPVESTGNGDDTVFKKWEPPRECSNCGTPLEKCKGVESSEMDGLHWWGERQSWWCDHCLLNEGEKEAEATNEPRKDA